MGHRAARAAFSVVGLATAVAVWATLLGHGVAGNLLGAIIIAFLLFYPAALAHELGHAFAAIHYRQPIAAIAVAPFELRFRPLRLSLAAAHAPAGTGGYVLYAGGGEPSRRAVGMIAAAGPLASLVLGVVAALGGMILPLLAPDLGLSPLVVTPATDLPVPSSNPTRLLPSDAEVRAQIALEARHQMFLTCSALSYALAVLSTGLGLTNLIPLKGSDGETILHCLLRPWSSGPA